MDPPWGRLSQHVRPATEHVAPGPPPTSLASLSGGRGPTIPHPWAPPQKDEVRISGQPRRWYCGNPLGGSLQQGRSHTWEWRAWGPDPSGAIYQPWRFG